ncbi:hypothetical protein P175DRAFT_0528421 [Aspergillus ochraceoroseus IBT 24754]|uniref:Secreted protein n=1 Tax=Aspergillus ochraceoroseus IBT 24754 TaxID=1392256 RepID=A0A2T5M8Q8_9EURO|nr:uncharacterized protein P175DRAFT_0528421 [Aspergillus ochraceoroseus IBT 24754]PTU24905.1 hypothetical protein P175DRAFT_0528421 [Aspergillus ochraceoroseus IBT 24754]
MFPILALWSWIPPALPSQLPVANESKTGNENENENEIETEIKTITAYLLDFLSRLGLTYYSGIGRSRRNHGYYGAPKTSFGSRGLLRWDSNPRRRNFGFVV